MLIPLGETKHLSPAPALCCRVFPRAESLICPGSGYILPSHPAQHPLSQGAAVRPGIYRVANTPEDRWFPINVFNHVDCGSRQGCVPRGTGSGSPGVHQRSAAGDTFAAEKCRVGMKHCQGRHPTSPMYPGVQRWVCSCREVVGNMLLAAPRRGARWVQRQGWMSHDAPVFVWCFPVRLAQLGCHRCVYSLPLYLGKIGMLMRPQLLWAPMAQNTKNCSGSFRPIPKLAADS